MKYFSAFTGVGGFDMGMPEGWECVGHSEVDKYANMVLRYRYKDVINYGNIEKIEWKEIPDFDMLVGGTPCQDLSIAGKREGLDGRRSGLFFEFIRCLREKQPRYFIWENVKGALSSNEGWDFARVLIEFSEAGYDLWWQVLDATDFGIPQHRERIFILGNLGERCFREVFFEPESSGAHIELQEQSGNTITRRYRSGEANGTYIIESEQQTQIENVHFTRTQQNRIYGINGISSTLHRRNGGGQTKIAIPVLEPAFKTTRANGRRIKEDGDPAFTIRRAVRSGVAIPVSDLTHETARQNGRRVKTHGEPSFTLQRMQRQGTYDGMKIRYLTPLECERLMGWDDNWTRYGIDEKGNTVELSDNARYNLIGNGVVPQVVSNVIRIISPDRS